MINDSQLFRRFSIGISFYKMTSDEWIKILDQFNSYINDVFFSPIESIDFQTRRNIYNYDKQDQNFLEAELRTVLRAAKQLGIARKLVLNVPMFYNRVEPLVTIYEKYRREYEMEYVTTFLPCARQIKSIDCTQKIVCSYNEGIKTYNELENILATNVFCSIVLGTCFLRDIHAFKLVHKYNQKVELLLNNGCMTNCESFCSLPNRYCVANFAENLSKKDINSLYAECSIFPEELHKYLLATNLIDYYKLSSRPTYFDGLVAMISSYINGDSYTYINQNINNYNLYGRLAHFSPYYKVLQYEQILKDKDCIWECIK